MPTHYGELVFLLLACFLVGLLWLLASSIVFRLAIPVMYIRRMKAWPAVKVAWRELFLRHMGSCLLFFLLSIVISFIKGFASSIGLLVLSVFTVCIAYVVVFIPVAGNYPVALGGLPVYVFDRAYCLHFISQFGPEYQIAWQVPAVGGFPVIMDNAPAAPGPSGA